MADAVRTTSPATRRRVISIGDNEEDEPLVNSSPTVDMCREPDDLSREEMIAEIHRLRSETSMARSKKMEVERGGSIVLGDKGFTVAFIDRGLWLIGLLMLQSCSTFILARNERLIRHHPSVVFFLTMLVGAGGNAGNQAAVIMVRAQALSAAEGKASPLHLLRDEVFMALGLTGFIGSAGLLRVALSPHTDVPESIAITLSLCIIVFVSIILGALLPFGLEKLHLDPAHSSTSIQVIMDIFGVFLTCGVTHVLLNTDLGESILDFVGITA